MDEHDPGSGERLEEYQRQLVLFRLENEFFGVDIHQVREIIRVAEITRVPHTPEYVEGIINLRGGVIPVVDLRRRFGLPPADRSGERRIIVAEIEKVVLGIIVDGVSEVLRISESGIEPPSEYIIAHDSDYIEGTVKDGERLIILLALQRLFTPAEREGAAYEGEESLGL